jgi:hypothetical protein
MGMDYTALRHARVEGPDVAWVAIGHWVWEEGPEWCVEYWDAQGEVTEDKCFGTEAEAQACAEREFPIKPEDWRDGPQPLGSSAL